MASSEPGNEVKMEMAALWSPSFAVFEHLQAVQGEGLRVEGTELVGRVCSSICSVQGETDPPPPAESERSSQVKCWNSHPGTQSKTIAPSSVDLFGKTDGTDISNFIDFFFFTVPTFTLNFVKQKRKTELSNKTTFFLSFTSPSYRIQRPGNNSAAPV
jgi:hypothetical protein